MKLRTLKLALLSALVASHAFATEYRSPWVSGNGPLRYSFEKLNEESWNLNLWSAMHVKQAHKSFTKHSTKTQPLTAVMFGKSDFKIEEIFPDAKMQAGTAGFNPLVGKKTLSPRAEYAETGMTVGLRFDYPVWEKHGRIGVRASAPFRRIEIERQDSGLDKNEDPAADYVKRQVVLVDRANDGAAGGAGTTANVLAAAYRMDLVSSLANTDGTPALVGRVAGANGVTLFNNNITGAAAAGAGVANTQIAAVAATGPVGIVGGVDNPAKFLYMAADGGNNSPANSRYEQANIRQIIADYALHADIVAGDAIGYFGQAVNYAGLLSSAGFQANADKTWLIFRRQTNTPEGEKFADGTADQGGVGFNITRTLDQMIAQYNINTFQYLGGFGYSLDSEIRSGMGDIDLDVFYEHGFSDDLVTELALGVRLPTGGDKDKYTGAYKAILGNGEHWELKLAGLVAYRPFNWMSVKADASYSFVLEGTERRCAVFKGSTVKNIGPRADADVSWSYMIGHVDFNFTHPETKDIRSMLGYEFYYKTKDNVKFKKSKMASWLGKVVATGAANEKDLSNTLAEKGTESITHKARFETSAQVLKHFEVFAGGAMAFAGQNAFRDRDAHCGFNVRF